MSISAQNSKFKNILFDFDGTLCDSSEGIFKSLTYAFVSLGHEAPSEELLRKFVGPPLYYSFSEFCGFSEEHSNEMTEKYRERYRIKGYLESRAYEGIPETLAVLKEAGFRLATASSKPLKFVDDICENVGIKQYFDYLGGTAFDNKTESKTVVIEKAMKALGADTSNTLMVGDRLFDIEGAHNAGIPCCGVLYGFGSREEFLEYNADFIVEAPKDLLSIL